eukprot:CAMPEP_0170493650 /NCGR_PEP_ID=MMETSP0208-20121228/14196_1 /TAXON_ID=197538 /ORGANISM="Strombidium inclinatum, Strain S3" /LENGTH=31 /DNA_ID= /DNA_START= /DNA_END= /DNA_ORIENTATION=
MAELTRIKPENPVEWLADYLEETNTEREDQA